MDSPPGSRRRSRSPPAENPGLSGRRRRRRSSSSSSVSHTRSKRPREGADRKGKARGDERRRQKGRPDGVPKLDGDDTARVAVPFRTWLLAERGKAPEDLNGTRRRKYLKRFAKAWNRGELSDALYHRRLVLMSLQAPSPHAGMRRFGGSEAQLGAPDRTTSRTELARNSAFGP